MLDPILVQIYNLLVLILELFTVNLSITTNPLNHSDCKACLRKFNLEIPKEQFHLSVI